MASFASNFARGYKRGSMTRVQEEKLREKEERAAIQRAKKSAEIQRLRIRADIEREKTKRASMRLFPRGGTI